MPLSNHDNANSCQFPVSQLSNTSNSLPQVPRSIKPWFYKPKKSRYGIEGPSPRKNKYNSHHWTELQNQKYIEFLKTYLGLVKSHFVQKRKFHLNRMLSKFIGTRSPIQCRSHHQKMIHAFKTPETIIAHFEEVTVTQNDNDKVQIRLEGSTSQLNIQTSFTFPQSVPQISQLHVFGPLDPMPYQVEDDLFLWDVLTFPEADQDYWND